HYWKRNRGIALRGPIRFDLSSHVRSSHAPKSIYPPPLCQELAPLWACLLVTTTDRAGGVSEAGARLEVTTSGVQVTFPFRLLLLNHPIEPQRIGYVEAEVPPLLVIVDEAFLLHRRLQLLAIDRDLPEALAVCAAGEKVSNGVPIYSSR